MAFKKILSLITAVCFLQTSVIAPVRAQSTQPRANIREALDGLMLPSNVARITNGHYFGTGCTVINIQDLHCHPEVQRNIVRTLEILNDQYRVKSILVEGAYGGVDTSWLAKLSDRKLRREIADAMLNDGRLTGAEYYSAMQDKPSALSGLEDEQLHKRNIARLGKILERQKRYEEKTKELKKDLAYLQAKYFNNRNRKFDGIIGDYRAGRITPRKFYLLLGKYVEMINGNPGNFTPLFSVGMDNYPNTQTYFSMLADEKHLDYGRVGRQMKEFLVLLKKKLPPAAYNVLLEKTDDLTKADTLYLCLERMTKEFHLDLSAGYPELNRFFGYMEKGRQVNPAELAKEENRLIEEIRTGLCGDVAEVEVSFLSDFFAYFEDYLNNRLSADDYPYFEQRFDRFREIWAKYDTGHGMADLAADFGMLNEYYKANEERNDSFIRNITSALPAGIDASVAPLPAPGSVQENIDTAVTRLNATKDAVIVITGGFHTAVIEKMLADRKLSSLTITPNITQTTADANAVYMSLARHQAGILANALQVTIASEESSSELLQMIAGALWRRAGLDPQQIEKALQELGYVKGIARQINKGQIEISFTDPQNNKRTIITVGKGAKFEEAPAADATSNIKTWLEQSADAAVAAAGTTLEVLREQSMGVLSDTLFPEDVLLSIAASLSENNLIIGNGLIPALEKNPQFLAIANLTDEETRNMPEWIQELAAGLAEHTAALQEYLKDNPSTVVRALLAVDLIRRASLMRQPAGKANAGETIAGEQDDETTPANAPDSGLIGKYEMLSTPEYFPEKGEIRFRARHVETKTEEEIVLRNVRAADRGTKAEIIESLRGIDNAVVQEITDWFEKELNGSLLVFDGNDYGIHGIGSKVLVNGKESSIIGLAKPYAGNYAAWFHEIAEAFASIRGADAETILAKGVNDRSWYDAHIAKSGRQRLKLHYAVRALQRETMSNRDTGLTDTIKGYLSFPDAVRIARERGIKRTEYVWDKFEKQRWTVRGRQQELLLWNRLIGDEVKRQLGEQKNRLPYDKRIEQLFYEIDALPDGALLNESKIRKIASRLDAYKHSPIAAEAIAQRVMADFPAFSQSGGAVHSFQWRLFTYLNQDLAMAVIDAIFKEMTAISGYGEEENHIARILRSLIGVRETLPPRETEKLGRQLITELKKRFNGRPAITASMIRDPELIEEYFDRGKEPSVLYFKDDFKEKIVWLRDTEKRRRLEKLYRETTANHEAFDKLVLALMTKDKNSGISGILMDELSSNAIDAPLRDEIISLLARSWNRKMANAAATLNKLLHYTIAALRAPGMTAPSSESLLNSLYAIAKEPSTHQAIFDYITGTDNTLFNRIKDIGGELRRADAVYQMIENEEGNNSEKLEKAKLKVHEIQRRQDIVMGEMQERLEILSLMAQTAAGNGNRTVSEKIIAYLIQVARNENLDTDITAKAAASMTPFIPIGNQAVIKFFLDNAEPDLSAENRQTLTKTLTGKSSDARINELLPDKKRFRNQRTGYLLLLRNRQDKKPLSDVIRDPRIDIQYRLYAFHLYAAEHLYSSKTNAYNEKEFEDLINLLQNETAAFVKTAAKDTAKSDDLFNNTPLQNEELKTYITAITVIMQYHTGQMSAEGFSKTAIYIENAQIWDYLYDSSEFFIFGGRDYRDTPVNERALFFLYTIAHEFGHRVLNDEHDYPGSELVGGVMHELLADTEMEILASLLNTSTTGVQESLTFAEYLDDVEKDDNFTVEAHEGARAQEAIIKKAIETQGATFDPARFFASGVKVIKDPGAHTLTIEQTVRKILEDYFELPRNAAEKPASPATDNAVELNDAAFKQRILGFWETMEIFAEGLNYAMRLPVAAARTVLEYEEELPPAAIEETNKPAVAERLLRGESSLRVAFGVATGSEFRESMLPTSWRRFVNGHEDRRGPVLLILATVAGAVAGAITFATLAAAGPFMASLAAVAGMAIGAAAANVSTHTLIDWYYINASGMKDRADLMRHVYRDNDGETHVPVEVYDRLPEDADEGDFINTGIRVEGMPIWLSTNRRVLAVVAENVAPEKVSEALSRDLFPRGIWAGNGRLKKEVRKLLEKSVDASGRQVLKGDNNPQETVFAPGIIVDERDNAGTIKNTDEGDLKVSPTTLNDLADLVQLDISAVIGWLSRIHRTEKNAAVESIGFLDESETLGELKENVRQFSAMGNGYLILRTKNFNELPERNRDKIIRKLTAEARKNGVRLYVDLSAGNEDSETWRELGFSGYFAGKDGQGTLFNFASARGIDDEISAGIIDIPENLKAQEFPGALKKALRESEKEFKIVRLAQVTRYLMDERSTEGRMAITDILRIPVLSAFTSRQITPAYVRRVAYHWDRANLPASPDRTAIEADAGVRIYLAKLREDIRGTDQEKNYETLKQNFIDGITERVLAKAALAKNGDETALADEDMERALGYLLRVQKNPNAAPDADIIAAVENDTKGNAEQTFAFMSAYVSRVRQNSERTDAQVATAVELLIRYAERKRTGTVEKKNTGLDPNTIKSILSAA